ncbi:HU family DNA-binding protein [Lactobacillus kefiranofaciens]|uniref:DNA-binding protein HU n=1 Tax=Lactobacillus kefiranofaciens TaxID=267818 RepID=A0AAX3UDQ1_9LACO|nr:HU family DNA-binding protein [Lactobacillus kefiranofaciens]AEG41784.1 hypothetical protein WANG_p1181 [Lactobacillus kefiranofaciens subsp. kefiranofaciens]KRM21772.1 hypothetical protein FC93_GL000312 [Lactobacillus kefiranofaciens subsp. kefiranofaciens DSM 5016 = JCM 6985]QFQ68405.1 hypothetical protein LKK75_08470 [Lactobacillus kefiranofaciens subsp. kefiranofaciens]WGO85800.1 HU family DNA-binding protein [Lactobacillus kefiranofaciens]WQH36880.1 HU family DNA-binding protein [Lacto
MSYITNGHRRFTGREISEELVKKMKGEKQTTVSVDQLPNIISTYFDQIADHLSSGDSVVVLHFGRFDVVKSKQSNFEKNQRNKSKKKHDYQKVKFSAVRKLKTRLAQHADKLN